MKADLTTKNTQKFENLEDLFKYKTFLDDISPNENKEKKEKVNDDKEKGKSN